MLIRGNLICVVDFAQFLGGAATIIDKQCRIIALAPALGMNAGLLVSNVVGLRNTSEMQEQGCDYVDHESLHWQLIDLEEITRSSQFHDVGA